MLARLRDFGCDLRGCFGCWVVDEALHLVVLVVMVAVFEIRLCNVRLVVSGRKVGSIEMQRTSYMSTFLLLSVDR